MDLVVDTTVVVAVITNEPHKQRLVELTRDADLLAPTSFHAEIANAFSAMFKRQRITPNTALAAVEAFRRIPIRLSDISLDNALDLSDSLGIYAYDAYVIACAQKHRCALVSLDTGLLEAARRTGVKTVEVIR